MNRAALLVLCVLLAILSAPPTDIVRAESSPIVRVCIADDKDNLSLALKGKYKMYALNSERVVMEGPYFSGQVKPEAVGLSFGKKDVKLDGVRVKVSKDANIYVGNRRFRGTIDIIKKDNKKLMVVNHVPLEEYLYGVLYKEVSHRWPMEALKAQAIVSRTFAIYNVRQNRLQPYDLRSDIYSQVYGGKTSEKWSTNRAVNLTKGKVLAFGGQMFPAYYHATCAGHTEDGSNLWAVDLQPLKGAVCDFCKASPHYAWKKEMPLWELENRLKENGYGIGKIASVAVLAKNRSGRVDKMEIKDNAGKSVILTGKDFRQMMGPNEIRSAKFDVSIKWGQLVFDGTGWGHGVGMCQWGAFGMAKHGKKAEEILKYYYPGAEITDMQP